jgi:prophage antirepressor-like protein
MSGIVPFAFSLDESVIEIRTICNAFGDPWFVLRDLLSAMKSSTTTTAAKLSVEQGLGDGLVFDLPLQTAGGIQTVALVAEAGATFLVSRSNTEAGKKLNRFIHLEVLPQIRKTGQYSRKLSPAEVIIQQGQIMLALEQEQIRQAAMQRQLESRQDTTEQRLNQIETAVDHFTILGWNKMMNQPTLTLEMAQRMGKKATNYCALNNIAIGKIPDPRFGTANSYPKWVLDELFLYQQGL